MNRFSTYIPRHYENPNTYLEMDTYIENNRARIFSWNSTMKQTADYLNAITYAHSQNAAADILLWEDDCIACSGTNLLLHQFRRRVEDTDWAYLKMGNGASGILINARHVSSLLVFVFSHIHVQNVDVAIYKYGNFLKRAYYHVSTTYSEHHGVRSNFVGYDQVTGPWCGQPMTMQWGQYISCERMQDLDILCHSKFLF
jgi:hypothetical protein